MRTWAGQRKDHLHVNVQRHCVERTRKHRKVCLELYYSCELCSQILAWTLVILVTRTAEEMYETFFDKSNEDWDRTAEVMMPFYILKAVPIFRATSTLGGGELRSKGKGKKSFHYNVGEETIELILRTIVSVINQLSIYGAVAEICYARNHPMTQRLQGNLQEMKTRKQWNSLLNFLLLTLTPTRSRRETCCKIVNINSNNFLKIKNYPNCVATPVWKLLKEDNSSLHLKDLMKWRVHVGSTRHLEVNQNTEREGGFSEIRRSAWSWMWRSAFIKDVTALKSWSNLCFETEQFLGFELWTAKNVTETSETIALEIFEHKEVTEKPVVFEHEEVTVKPVAKAKPQLKVSYDTVSCLYSYIDIDTQPFDHDCFAVSKAMIRLLRHGASVPRQDDGAVRVGSYEKNEAKLAS